MADQWIMRIMVKVAVLWLFNTFLDHPKTRETTSETAISPCWQKFFHVMGCPDNSVARACPPCNEAISPLQWPRFNFSLYAILFAFLSGLKLSYLIKAGKSLLLMSKFITKNIVKWMYFQWTWLTHGTYLRLPSTHRSPYDL